MQSKAATVAEYLSSLPPDRREAIDAVRKVILKNLDAGYTETMSYGMIGYVVPHSVYPAGYHCNPEQPLPFAGLASQKGHMSLYLMCVYGNDAAHAKFRKAWEATGKKLNMGKACVRFKKLEDVALDVLGATIKSVPAKLYIEHCEAALAMRANAASPRKKSSTPKSASRQAEASANKPTRKAKATVTRSRK